MKKTILILVLFVSITFSSFATHIIGGDLSYSYIGPKTYDFILTIYSECGSDAHLDDSYPIYYYSISRGIPLASPKNFILSRISEDEVQIFCSTVVSNCNRGTARGIKRHVYKGRVNLSAYAEAKDWVFYWRRAYRSEEITTLLNAENEEFFIQVTMDNLTAPRNNSPFFQSNPVITACKGKLKTFNHVAIDPDGDELRYSLISPRSDVGTNVIYKSGYNQRTFVNLVSPATINSITGDIAFTVTTLNQVGITDVLVQEYRNGVLIGSVVRGMQITTVDCFNTTPTLSNFVENNRDSIVVCAGERINLSIKGLDVDNQNLTLSLLKGKTTVFSIEENNGKAPVGKFIWLTTASDVGRHLFTVEVKDDGCPEPQIATKVYSVRVLSVPRFDLGANRTVNCGETVRLAPVVSGGDGKYSYLWSNGARTATVTVPIGTYSLTVTDGKGCSFTDNILIYGGLDVKFIEAPRCFGQPTRFEDKSTSIHGVINAWRWNFGDGGTSTVKNPSYTYTRAGIYEVELTITTDLNCSASIKKNVTICPPPVLDFKYLDSCTNTYNPVRFVDLTPPIEECHVIRRDWDWGDGTSSRYNYPLSSYDAHVYTTEGIKTVVLTVTTAAGCVSTVTKAVRIFKSPEMKIVEDDFYFKCSDTTLTTQVIYGGTGNLRYLWRPGGETSPSIVINNSGQYSVEVTDDYGCKYYDLINVAYPLSARFRFTPFCKDGDLIQFTSSITNYFNNPVRYEWDFGDGSPKSTLANPSHKYDRLGIYTTKLKVIDTKNGCEAEFSSEVYNTYMLDNFSVTPKHISICVRNIVTGSGPEIDPATGGIINSYFWDFGNGTYGNSRVSTTHYADTGTYVVRLRVVYNAQPGMNSGCIKEYSDRIKVFPEFEVDFDGFRVCVNDPVPLTFRRTKGDLTIGIKNARWEIVNNNTGQKDLLTEIAPVYTFRERAKYFVTLTAQDKIGCEYTISRDFFADVVADPDFTFNDICSNEKVILTGKIDNRYENVHIVKWDFGNNDTITTFYDSRAVNTFEKSFEMGGEYPVTLTVLSEKGCFKTVTKTIVVKDIPLVDFEFDTVCANEPVTFINYSTIASGSIVKWRWEYGDGTSSPDFNPRHIFPTGGFHKVRLTATSEKGCSQFIEKDVYVKDIPIADFSIEENLLEAFIPLHFIDKSKNDVQNHFWDFGDGTTSTEENPIHQYSEIKLYRVTHIVYNSIGCSDTIVKKTNLNVRLDLPTGFTPNGDNANDGLSLIHNGIKQLYEFKIYNRWGELIFDGGTNLNAVWDGHYKGKLQEVGTYVAYVRALGIYDTKFNFKKNVSLIK